MESQSSGDLEGVQAWKQGDLELWRSGGCVGMERRDLEVWKVWRCGGCGGVEVVEVWRSGGSQKVWG
jgi:hypothetical protein